MLLKLSNDGRTVVSHNVCKMGALHLSHTEARKVCESHGFQKTDAKTLTLTSVEISTTKIASK